MLQEAVKTPNESNPNPKPNYQVRGQPYVGKSPQMNTRNVLYLITTFFVKKNMMSRTQQVRGDPYVDQNPQSVACLHLHMLKKIIQVRGNPYWRIKKRNAKLISQSSRIVTCSCEGSRTCPSSIKSLYIGSKLIFIEKHFMPTCSRTKSTTHSAKKKSKEMIRELGNVELFELCENTPRVQCSQRLLYWNQGIVYCTCGQCLIYNDSRRKIH